jgi:hypothetical protein
MTMDENQSSSEKNTNDHDALGAVEALLFLSGAPVPL